MFQIHFETLGFDIEKILKTIQTFHANPLQKGSSQRGQKVFNK